MEGTLGRESQKAAAKRMYDARATNYDDSHHPSFARDFVAQLPLFPGARVLDLACGTGLVTFLAADAVGPTGSVTGVDVSPGMLAIAHQKLKSGAASPTLQLDSATDLLQIHDDQQPADPDRWNNVRIFEHSVTELDSLPELAGEKGTYDFITMSSALVLLTDPAAAIRSWLPYLKPNGFLALDVPHTQNLISGIILERIGRRMGVPVPYHRGWVFDESSLPDMLKAVAGMEIVSNELVPQLGYGERVFSIDPAETERQFTAMIGSEAGKAFGQNRGPKWEEARILFYEEWALEAERAEPGTAEEGGVGGVREVDGVWLTIARKPPVSGSCRCGAVRYAVAEPPGVVSACHCRTCQKLSGTGSMTVVDFRAEALTWLDDSDEALKKIEFSKNAVRAFCASCGAPVYMQYKVEPDGELEEHITPLLSTVDEGLPPNLKIKRHIFLDEKPAWEVLPDDGAERWKKMDGEEPWEEEGK